MQFFIKRLFDIIFSIFILIIFSPFLLIISMLVKLTSKGDIFFTQERVGKDGKIFKIYKFRTMQENAEFVRDGLAVKSGDSRITPLGRVLRKTSLDEIPQFINVLLGDLSIVGPRPALSVQLKYYSSWHRRRLEVRPGITGLATVKGRCSIPWSRRIELDIEYIDKFSLILDFKILFKTIYVVLAGINTYYDPSKGPAFDLADPDDLPQSIRNSEKSI